jgi:hypothetical protein
MLASRVLLGSSIGVSWPVPPSSFRPRMDLWNPARLADRLRADAVPSREQARYLILSSLLQLSLGRLSVLGPREFLHPASLLTLLLGGLVAVLGLRRCAAANARGDDRELGTRYFCLALPLTLRLYALWFGVAAVLHFVAGSPARVGTSLGAQWALWAGSLALWLWGLTWYFRTLARYMARASGAERLAAAS